MRSADSAIYIQGEQDSQYVGYVAQDYYFMVIRISNCSFEEGNNLIQVARERLNDAVITSLLEFEKTIEDIIEAADIPIPFSLATGVVLDPILYLKTYNEGEIYLEREGKTHLLLKGDTSASGYIKDNDSFFFTTHDIIDRMPLVDFAECLKHKKPQVVVQELTNKIDAPNESLVGLSVHFSAPQQASVTVAPRGVPVLTLPVKDNPMTEYHLPLKQKSTLPRFSFDKKSVIRYGILFIILITLLTGIYLGYTRRSTSEREKKIRVTTETIEEQLTQAADVAFLNLPRAMMLLSDSKAEIAKLKTDLGTQKNTSVDRLEQLIQETEAKIVKKDDKTPIEFYDLTLEDKDASGSILIHDGADAVIFDQNKGVLYSFSLTKKSITKKTNSELRNAKLFALSKGDIYFYVPSGGIFKFSDSKVVKVLEPDPDWGTIADMKIYGGNIYLLDQGKETVYKYVAIDSGYGSKSSYLRGEYPALKDAGSLAIDSSVYISLIDRVIKFTSGTPDSFTTQYPDSSTVTTRVIATKDDEKVYVWDKKNSAVYVLGKDGTYEKQVRSSVFAKANDVTVFEGKIYLLLKEKVYTVSLE